ncbi:MAG: oxidoreductase [Betaproteobacteria bacterium]|nr:oxidoreductase [Betaproteobacteria bacterium]
MKHWARVSQIAALLILLVAGSAWAQQAPVVGRDYTQVSPPQPTDSGKKVEVVEFFWYGCPHCYHLEPSLKAWLKRKPADVEFRPIPGTFGAPTWEPLTRTYYALDAMGVAPKYHDVLFAGIHEEKDSAKQRALVNDSRAIADFLASKGVDKQKFLDAYNSFAVNSRTKRSEDLTRSYDVPGTPAVAIDGKYLTSPSNFPNPDGSVNYDRFFNVVDQLVAQARKDRAGKK